MVRANEACPDCRKAGNDSRGDNLVRFADGGASCFACGYRERKNIPLSTNQPPAQQGLLQGNAANIEHRGLSKRTCEFFKYNIGNYTGYIGRGQDREYVTNTPVHIANYCNQFGVPTVQKIRGPNKKMTIIGPAQNMTLYGQWLWEPTSNLFVTVVEGEIDAISVAEVQGLQYPVVSVPNGAQSAKDSIKQNLEWLQKFKHVVLAFDNDEAGQKATQECMGLFEPNKVKVAVWPLKDANEMLVQGRAEEIKRTILNARAIKPDGIVTYSDIKDHVLEQPTVGLSWPWPSMTTLTYGIRPNELITVMAATGIGKTEIVTEVFLHLIQKHGVKVGVMSFEQPPHKTYQRSIGKLLNKRIHVPGVEFDRDEVDRLGREVFENKLYCYGRSGTVGWDDVRAKLLYYVKALDCKVIVIDNLSSIAAKFDTDERRGIDKAMLELSELVMTLNITIIMVCHVSRAGKKEGRKSFEEGGKIRMSDARGSEGIGQHSTYVFGLERNTMADDEEARYITTVRCLKDREFGVGRGQFFNIYYNKETGRLEEIAV